MNEKKKKRGFAGKAGESRRAGSWITIAHDVAVPHGKRVITTKVVKGKTEFIVATEEVSSKKSKRLRYNQTQVLKVDYANWNLIPVFTDADVLGSIKAHLRACERCYYGDKK